MDVLVKINTDYQVVIKNIKKRLEKTWLFKKHSYICIYLLNNGWESTKLETMRTINIHMISISNWRRNSHPVAGMFIYQGGTEV